MLLGPFLAWAQDPESLKPLSVPFFTVVLKMTARVHHSHDLAPAIGRPPGYIGHREIALLKAGEKDRHTDGNRLTFVTLVASHRKKALGSSG